MPDLTKITEPGIFFDISADAYFADPCPQPSLTQSLCKVLLNQSALHAMHEHPRLAPPVEADEPAEKYVAAQAIGNAVHATLIGRGKTLAVGEFDNWRTKDAQKFREIAEQHNRTPILHKHMTQAHDTVLAVRLQLVNAGWSDAFREGHGEAVVCWQEDGLWFRTMIDWTGPHLRTAYDLKTTAASFAPHIIGRKMVDDGWDIQAAMHERALDAIDPKGAGRRKFRFVAIENYPPYAMVPVEITETWLTMGRKKLDAAIGIWRAAMRSGRFEGYPTTPVYPEYPGWQEKQWLERELTDEFKPRSDRHADNILAG